jgi:HEAT repeat protein
VTPANERRTAELVGMGHEYARIAEIMSTSVRSVQRVMSVPEMKKLASEVRETRGDPDAVSVLKELLLDPSPSIRLGAAKALLVAPPQAEPDAGAVLVSVVETFKA